MFSLCDKSQREHSLRILRVLLLKDRIAHIKLKYLLDNFFFILCKLGPYFIPQEKLKANMSKQDKSCLARRSSTFFYLLRGSGWCWHQNSEKLKHKDALQFL